MLNKASVLESNNTSASAYVSSVFKMTKLNQDTAQYKTNLTPQ